MTLALTSPAFVSLEDGGAATGQAQIPTRFAMTGFPGGHNVSLPYAWVGSPAETQSFALILLDTAPVANNWVHWVVVDIPASVTTLPEGASGTPAMPSGTVELRNTFGFAGYGGPQPPPRTGAHTYVATLYALDIAGVPATAYSTLPEVLAAMSGHVLVSQTCTGLLGR